MEPLCFVYTKSDFLNAHGLCAQCCKTSKQPKRCVFVAKTNLSIICRCTLQEIKISTSNSLSICQVMRQISEPFFYLSAKSDTVTIDIYNGSGKFMLTKTSMLLCSNFCQKDKIYSDLLSKTKSSRKR